MSTATLLWQNIGGTWTRKGRVVIAPPPAPVVSTFTPATGPVGTRVTVTGSALTGATQVLVGATAQTFTVTSDAQLSFTVATGTLSGPIKVTTPNGQVTSSASFTVTTTAPTPTPTPPPTQTLATQRLLAPVATTGALWGYYASGNNIPALETMESGANRQYDILKSYVHTDLNWPTAAMLTGIREGRIPHFSFAWRATGKGGATGHPLLPPPNSSNKERGTPYNECYLYSQMYDGSADAWLGQLAVQWKRDLGSVPAVMFDFNHEPEATQASATATPSASAQIRMGCFSDPKWYYQDPSGAAVGVNVYTEYKHTVLQEYVRAAKYMVDFLRAKGVDNLVNICTHASVTRPNWQHQALYQPDCDGFGFDPYSGTDVPTRWGQVYTKLEAGMFVTWDPAVTKNGLGGTPLDPQAKSKPYFVQEWGILTAPADATYATYISTVINALTKYPKIKACTFYGAGSGAIVNLPQSVAAFQAASRDPYVNKRA